MRQTVFVYFFCFPPFLYSEKNDEALDIQHAMYKVLSVNFVCLVFGRISAKHDLLYVETRGYGVEKGTSLHAS